MKICTASSVRITAQKSYNAKGFPNGKPFAQFIFTAPSENQKSFPFRAADDGMSYTNSSDTERYHMA